MVASSTHPGATLQVLSVVRIRDGVVRAELRVMNDAPAGVRVTVDHSRTVLVVGSDRYRAIDDDRATGPSGIATRLVGAGGSTSWSIDFAVPDAVSGKAALTIAADASSDSAQFPSLALALPVR